MKYYLDITLIPGDGMSLYPIWEKVYQQLHLALVEQAYEIEDAAVTQDGKHLIKKSKVGVSFPKYNQKSHFLGNKLRLFAMAEEDIQALNLDQFFSRLDDYVHKTSIKAVPDDKITGYAFFKRQQFKSNNERLARRRSAKMKINFNEALAFFNENARCKQPELTETDAPFIYLNSQSKSTRFPLFIVMEKTEQQSSLAEFSSYGLSSECSVPTF